MNLLCRQPMKQFCSSHAETLNSIAAAKKRCSETAGSFYPLGTDYGHFHIISTTVVTLWVFSPFT